MSKQHFFTFEYGVAGFGALVLHNNSLVELQHWARTGSRNRKGKLVKAIPLGLWAIRRPSVDTTEAGMTITPGMGWKVRLYRHRPGKTPEWGWTHYLIHPDGNLPGTLGCVGLQDSDGVVMRNYIDRVLLTQELIEVRVGVFLEQ